MNSNYSNLSRGLTTSDVNTLITTQVPDPLTVAKGGTGATSAADARDSLQVGPSTPIYIGDATWAGATVSGTVLAAAYSGGRRVALIQASTAGFHRYVYTTGGFSNPIVGTSTQVNYSLSFRTTIRGRFQVGTNSGAICSLHIGCASTPTAHDPVERSHVIQIAGDGSSGRRVRVITHNGTTTSASSWATWTPGITDFSNLELIWLTGTSLTLRVDGIQTCQVTTTLPSGLGTANSTNLGQLTENVAGSAVQVYNEIISWETTRIL
jgi:hypothetical protein